MQGADYKKFLVICKDDAGHPLRVLATRQVFDTFEKAREYARGIAASRRAEVVGCVRDVEIKRVD